MLIRILQFFLLITVIIFSGCRKQNEAAVANNTQALIEDTNITKSTDTVRFVSDNEQQKPTVIAYYFHRTMRCPTCMAIEANTAKVIKADLQKQLSDGSLTWLPTNLDDPGGEKLEKQFDISISTLVIAKIRNDKVAEFKKLDKVWQLVGDDKAFFEYVKSEIQEYLNDK